MPWLRAEPRLDVVLRPEELRPGPPDLFQFKLLYLHGRGRFSFAPEELENLRADLATGGLLLADACCGKPAFDAAFREFAAKLFPGAKLEPIPVTDPLYGAEGNGSEIRSVRVRRGGAPAQGGGGRGP